MGENALLRKLEASVISNNKKAFIDIIFDFTTDDILALTEDEFNRITDISHQIKLEDVGEFFSYLESEGVFHLKNAMSGSNELNNLLISRFYLGLFLCMFQEHNEKFASAITNYGTVCSLLSGMGVNTQQNLKEAIELTIGSISILERLKDGGTYSIALLNLNKFLISNFRKSGDRKYLEEAKGILEDAEAKIKDREVWDKEILLATLHEVRANLLEFEGKQGIHKASREYQEAYKLTGNQFYRFMDEFLQARIDIGSFCDLVGSWEKTGKTEIFLDYYDYSVFECHLEKAVSGSSTDLLNREKEFRSALKKLKEIEERTQIKPIKDRVSAYVYLMDALADCFRRDTYAAARAKVRAACEIFHKCDDRDGRKTCDIFYNAIVKNEGFDAWLEIMRNKDRISCNFYRLLREGAGSKISKVDHRRLHETTARIEEKVDNISDAINDLDASYERIRISMEQGFADQDANLQNIMGRLDGIRQKLVELDEISKRFGGTEGESIRRFSKQILQMIEKNDSDSLKRFVEDVINGEDSLMIDIEQAEIPEKDKKDAKDRLKSSLLGFKGIRGNVKKEMNSFGKDVVSNTAATLVAGEIIKYVVPLISASVVGIPIPSKLLDLLSKAIIKS